MIESTQLFKMNIGCHAIKQEKKTLVITGSCRISEKLIISFFTQNYLNWDVPFLSVSTQYFFKST